MFQSSSKDHSVELNRFLVEHVLWQTTEMVSFDADAKRSFKWGFRLCRAWFEFMVFIIASDTTWGWGSTCSDWLGSIANIDASGDFDFMSISISFIGMDLWSCSSKLWVGSVCILNRKSAAAFARPGMCPRTIL